MSGLGRSTVQLADELGRLINLYVCLVVCIEPKLQLCVYYFARYNPLTTGCARPLGADIIKYNQTFGPS